MGFGTYREGLQRMVGALAARDLDALREIAARGRELEGGPPGGLSYLSEFLDGVGEDYLAAGPAAAGRLHFTGRLEYEDLPDLLPACEAQVQLTDAILPSAESLGQAARYLPSQCGSAWSLSPRVLS